MPQAAWSRVRNTDSQTRVFPTLLNRRGRTLVLKPGEEADVPGCPEDIAFLLVTPATPFQSQEPQYSQHSPDVEVDA